MVLEISQLFVQCEHGVDIRWILVISNIICTCFSAIFFTAHIINNVIKCKVCNCVNVHSAFFLFLRAVWDCKDLLRSKEPPVDDITPDLDINVPQILLGHFNSWILTDWSEGGSVFKEMHSNPGASCCEAAVLTAEQCAYSKQAGSP